jgi:hypothetical protein
LIDGVYALLSEVAHQRVQLGQLEQYQIAQTQEPLTAPRTDFRHKPKVAAPIIPFILSYEGEVELSGGVNLEEILAWAEGAAEAQIVNFSPCDL